MKTGYYWVYDTRNEEWKIVYVINSEGDRVVCFLEKKETEPLEYMLDKSFVGPIQVPNVQLCTKSMIDEIMLGRDNAGI